VRLSNKSLSRKSTLENLGKPSDPNAWQTKQQENNIQSDVGSCYARKPLIGLANPGIRYAIKLENLPMDNAISLAL
jgi:hypothetical protein